MKLPASASPWQPLTFGGVAAFARGPVTRLLQVQCVAAAIATGTVVWFLVTAWIPAFESALAHLPEEGAIRGGTLDWVAATPHVLGETSFISFTVDAERAANPGTAADVQVVLGPRELRVGSLLGHWNLPYPRGWWIALSKTAATGWWRAWQPLVLAGFVVGPFLALVISWWLIAGLYALPVHALARTLGRDLTRLGAWKLAGAALLPPALLVSAALVLYSLHRLPLIGFLSAWALHWIIGWIYALLSPWRLPRAGKTAAKSGNPFTNRPAASGPRRRRSNPFAR